MIPRELAEKINRDVMELGDRTSPDDWPEAMLVTGDELCAIVEEHAKSFAAEIAAEARRAAVEECARHEPGILADKTAGYRAGYSAKEAAIRALPDATPSERPEVVALRELFRALRNPKWTAFSLNKAAIDAGLLERGTGELTPLGRAALGEGEGGWRTFLRRQSACGSVA